MPKINCLIVEDEPLAAELIADYVNQVPHLALSGICHKATDALEKIRQKSVDLLFLDLHLPGIKGFDFLRTLSDPPKVIVTTAYHQYALEGYDLDVVDYLIKPIEFPRFLKAVNKLDNLAESVPTSVEKPITFTSNRKKIPVLPSEIFYVESQKDYVNIHLEGRIVRSKMTLQSVEAFLPALLFLRIHKSFIVSLKKIEAYKTQSVMICGVTLPIGRNYLAYFQQHIKNSK